MTTCRSLEFEYEGEVGKRLIAAREVLDVLGDRVTRDLELAALDVIRHAEL